MSLSLRSERVLKAAMADKVSTLELISVLNHANTPEQTKIVSVASAGVQEISSVVAIANSGGVKEITDVVAIADGSVQEISSIVAIADGSVQEISSIVTTAEGSIKEVSQITADSRTNTTDGQYFDISAQSGGLFRIYMDTTGANAVIPAAGGRTLTRCDISACADTAIGVGDVVAGVLDGLADFVCPATGTGVILATDVNFGAATDVVNGNLANAWAFATSAQGAPSLLNGKYFLMYDDVGSVAFWFDVNNSGTPEPAHGATRGVEISTVTSAMTAGQVGTAVYAIVVGDAKFEPGSDDTAGNLLIKCTPYGARTNSTAGDSGFTVGQSVAGVDSALDGKYFIMHDDVGSVAFWFDVDNRGTAEPAHGAGRGIEINTITSAMSKANVGTAVYTAVVADSKFEPGSDDLAGNLLVKCTPYGARTNSTAETSGFTVGQSVAGVDSALDGKYFTMYDDAGSVAFWFDVDNRGTVAPAHGATRGVEINTITSAMTKGQVGTAVYTAVIADAKFEAGSDDLAGNLLVKCTPYGARTNSAAGTSGFAVGESVAGVDSALDGKYFLLEDFAGTVAFWFDVDNRGTVAPAHGAARGVEISTVTSAMTKGQVGTAVYNAVIADSKFEAGTDDAAGNLTIKNSFAGPMTAQAAGTSGFTVGEDTPGVAPILDAKFFKMYDDVGSVGIWFDVDNKGATAPAGALACDRALAITTVTDGMSKPNVGTAVYTAVVADSKFEAGSDDLAGNLLIKCTPYGARTASTAQTSGFTVGRSVAGVNSVYKGKYFILEDEVGTVGFWFDVDNAGDSIPGGAAGCDRAVEITTVNSNHSIAQVSTALYNAIDADAKFVGVYNNGAEQIYVASSTVGEKLNGTAGSSPLVVSEWVKGDEESALTLTTRTKKILRWNLLDRTSYNELVAALEAASPSSALSLRTKRIMKAWFCDNQLYNDFLDNM